jgi:hypothetical protein
MLSAKFHFNLGSGLRREDIFRNRPIRNKNYLWLPCLQTDRDKISVLLRGTSIDASYQFSVHLGKQFQRRRLDWSISAQTFSSKTASPNE